MSTAIPDQVFDATRQVLFKIGEPFLALLPGLLTLFIVGLLGWLLGLASQRIAASLLSRIKLDAWLHDHDLSTPFSHYSISALLAQSLHGLIFALFLKQALDNTPLGILQPIASFLVSLIPTLLLGLWTILIALISGRVLKKTIDQLDYPHRSILGHIAETLCLVAGVLSALYQLRVDEILLKNITLILFGGCAIALAIGIGLRIGLQNTPLIFGEKTPPENKPTGSSLSPEPSRSNRAP